MEISCFTWGNYLSEEALTEWSINCLNELITVIKYHKWQTNNSVVDESESVKAKRFRWMTKSQHIMTYSELNLAYRMFNEEIWPSKYFTRKISSETNKTYIILSIYY